MTEDVAHSQTPGAPAERRREKEEKFLLECPSK
jgi:hypothetical protein